MPPKSKKGVSEIAGFVQRALLIGVFPSGKESEDCFDSLKELADLSNTCGICVVHSLACPIKKIQSSTYIGKGKIEEIVRIISSKEIDGVIFDHEISPNQQRNLENLLQRPVLDRTEVILDVFALRAQTREAILQIECAKICHQLSRLKNLWRHLSRQKVGSGGKGGALRGEGEKQIEVDKRLLKAKAHLLKKEIEEIRLQRKVARQARMRSPTPVFAIVGYTNSGKSTLLNTLTNAHVLVEDKLFATLDPIARKVFLPNHQKVIVIDSVGFIQNLPHILVAAFRSTLEEACYADVLLHVVDLTHKNAAQQAETTLRVLEEIGVKNKMIITLLNKIDRVRDFSQACIFRMKYPKVLCISAQTGDGMSVLKEEMSIAIANLRRMVRLKIPQSEYQMVSEIMNQGNILQIEYLGESIFLEADIPIWLEDKVRSFLVSSL